MYARIASLLILAAAVPAFGATTFPTGTYMQGDHALTFAEHGKLELKAKDEVVLNGTWSADADKVTITDVSGSYACAAPNATGVYSWTASGGGISFKKQKDGCDDRVQSLEGKPWNRKS